LQPYTFKVVYKPGATNPADYLSRHPIQSNNKQQLLTEEYVNFIASNSIPSVQSQVDEFTRKSTANKFQLNEEKCKELQITFARPGRTFTPVYVNNRPIEVVPSAKILGMRITNDPLNGIPTSQRL
jgi:hypothetical protein